MSVERTTCPRCGASANASRLGVCASCLLSDDPSPSTIGGLEIEEEIGRGGMGTVFRARHLRLGRTVAVKFLPEELSRQPELQARFEREARALALLDHPNVVRIHDFGREDDQSWIVMEHVAGKPLSASIPMTPARAVAIGIAVCDALAYAHAHGVVHRDVKPENILIADSGAVKVTDFGIARIVGREEPNLTREDQRPGTPAYMSPEALAGAAPDPRMDLYSLGVVLYEAVSGRLPVGDVPPLPGPLDRVVRRAMAHDPAKRYRDAEAMRADLVAIAGSAGEALTVDERTWVQAVALLLASATGISLLAFLASVTPRILAPGEEQPLIMIGGETLADGRIVSRARFEPAATLGAIAAVGIASAAYAVLLRHWRQSGLLTREPDRKIPQSRAMLAIGVIACVVAGLRRLVQPALGPLAPYTPLVGGLIEVAGLYVFWTGMLELRRTDRPLHREPLLFAGMALALIPPATELVLWLRAWHP